jgi:hypothetical protein
MQELHGSSTRAAFQTGKEKSSSNVIVIEHTAICFGTIVVAPFLCFSVSGSLLN